MRKTEVLRPLEPEPSRKSASRTGQHPRLRSRDLEALRRLLDQGPITIPQAYDCGHAESETTGHGMNRLVAASLAIFYGWDDSENDGLWSITEQGKRALLGANDRPLRSASHKPNNR